MMEKNLVDLKKIVFAIILVVAVTSCAMIYGLPEYAVAALQTVTVGAFVLIILWIVYKNLILILLDWFDESVTDGVKSTSYPLLAIIGKLVIAMGAVCYFMSYMGVDVLFIITSAGIVGLAITFGAQSTLSQFFSGLNLIISRPFKVGDVVRINGDSVNLRVRKIGMMNTVFDDWGSAETFTMPNNTVTSATIVNMTWQDRAFAIDIFLELSWLTDFELAKKLMEQAAEMTDHVVCDGSDLKPDVVIVDYSNDRVRIKFQVFIRDYNYHEVVASDVRFNLNKLFKENGLEFCKPKMNVYMRED